MPLTAEKPKFNEEDAAILSGWANSRTFESRMVQRARIIQLVAHGESDVAIAARLGITVFTVGKWRWFIGEGLECLSDRPCSGKLRSMTPFETRNAILSKLEKSAHKGQTAWDGKALLKALDISDDKACRFLRAEGICLRKKRSW